MKKENNTITFIIVSGILTLIVFTYVLTFNIINNNQSKSYYIKVEDEMSAKIESLNIIDNKLYIETSNDAVSCCVKTTKSTPTESNLCWKEINNNKAIVNIYHNKQYYVWIKDSNGNISNPMSINPKHQEN